MEESNISVEDKYIKYCVHGGRDIAEVQTVLGELLNSDDRPDAIFAASDRITTTTLELLHDLGFKIPDDIALLGFSNTHLAKVLNPSLSTVCQPGFEMGKIATEMIIKLIESKRPVTEFETVVLPTEVIIRDSSQPASIVK